MLSRIIMPSSSELDPENEGTVVLQNAGNYSPICTVSLRRRLEFSEDSFLAFFAVLLTSLVFVLHYCVHKPRISDTKFMTRSGSEIVFCHTLITHKMSDICSIWELHILMTFILY